MLDHARGTERASSGVDEAEPSRLDQLYGRYARLVYGVALAILGSREEAEDVTQEVFEYICGPTRYDPDRGTVSAFLTIMTRSRAIDRLRRRGRSARLLKTWHEGKPTAPAPRTAFEHISMRRTAERMRAVLAELPWPQRQVLEMAYYGGLTQREIAADLGTPLGTVKTLSRRALMTLRRDLENSTHRNIGAHWRTARCREPSRKAWLQPKRSRVTRVLGPALPG